MASIADASSVLPGFATGNRDRKGYRMDVAACSSVELRVVRVTPFDARACSNRRRPSVISRCRSSLSRLVVLLFVCCLVIWPSERNDARSRFDNVALSSEEAGRGEEIAPSFARIGGTTSLDVAEVALGLAPDCRAPPSDLALEMAGRAPCILPLFAKEDRETRLRGFCVSSFAFGGGTAGLGFAETGPTILLAPVRTSTRVDLKS